MLSITNNDISYIAYTKSIYEYAVKQNFSDEDFRFKQAEYPTAEVVDLR